MFKKNKGITHRDYDNGVRESLFEAQEQSKNPMEQFLWVKNNQELSYQQKIINMIDLVQMNFSIRDNTEIKLTDGHIDLLTRAFGDSLRHMQEDLPEGVYRFIYSNTEKTLEEIMKQKYERTDEING